MYPLVWSDRVPFAPCGRKLLALITLMYCSFIVQRLDVSIYSSTPHVVATFRCLVVPLQSSKTLEA